jgi:hypothetical protein
MTRLLTSVGALAVAAMTFAGPADAEPKGGDQQQCINLCYHLPNQGFARCLNYCLKTFPHASAASNVRAKSKAKPITGGAPPSTQRRR